MNIRERFGTLRSRLGVEFQCPHCHSNNINNKHIGLIPNVSYGDFVLGSNINMRPLQNPFYKKLSSPSFADLFLGQRKVKQTFFSQINTIIDWTPIRAIIEVAYTKGYKSTGRPSYDSLVLFKIELLRTWYGLSDGEVEDQVNDCLSFSRFTGLGMEDIVPDSTTKTQKPVG